MSGNVKQFVDFAVNTANDSGENNATSIRPIVDGENVSGVILTRPSESLRQRTEAIRDTLSDSLYLRDSDRAWVVTGPRPTITWPGSTTVAASGIPVLGNALWLVPLLTPGAQANTPPVASAFGVLHLKRSSDSANAISVTSRRRSYAAGDQINVTVSSGGAFTCTLDVETGYRRTIKIVATGTTTLGTVITALNGLTPPSPDNTQLVTAALEGGASSGDFLLSTQARQFVTGNYDGEVHVIGVSTMSSFFSSNPTQALAEGDTLCVRYDMVTDTASTGGRRQSLLENSNVNLTAGSLFNSRVHPEFLPNAIPVCKVINNDLVFPGGRTIQSGSVLVSLAGNKAADMDYAGGPAWADGTTNPATSIEGQLDKIITDLAGSGAAKITYAGGPAWADASTNPSASVEVQLDKIISDLSASGGTAKVGGAAIGGDLIAGTLLSQLTSLVNDWFKLGRANVVTADQQFNNNVTVFGVLHNPGVRTHNPAEIAFSASAGGLYSPAVTSSNTPAAVALGTSTSPHHAPLTGLLVGEVITAWAVILVKNTDNTKTILATLYEQSVSGITVIDTNSTSANAPGVTGLVSTLTTPFTVASGRSYAIEIIGSGTSGDSIRTYSCTVT